MLLIAPIYFFTGPSMQTPGRSNFKIEPILKFTRSVRVILLLFMKFFQMFFDVFLVPDVFWMVVFMAF